MKNFIKKVFFPSYKRTISVLVVLILVLSVPITLRLVGQQQDLRQRAEGIPEDGLSCSSILSQVACDNTNQKCFWYQGYLGEEPTCKDNNGNMNQYSAIGGQPGLCGTGHCYRDQSCHFLSDASGNRFYCSSTSSPEPERGNFVTPTPNVNGGAPASSPNTPAATTNSLPAPSFTSPGFVSGCNSITLNWGASAGATSYIIRQYNTAGVAEDNYSASYTTSATTHNVTGLTSSPITAYFFNIYASTNGTTPASPKVSVLANTGACTAAAPAPTAALPPPAAGCIMYQTCNSTGYQQVLTNPPLVENIACPTGTICQQVAPTGSFCKMAQCVTAPPQSTVPPPSTSESTTFAFTLSLPGIGSGGLGRNPNPGNPGRNLQIAAFSSQGEQVSTGNGSVTWDSSSGSFKGSASLTGLISGSAYSIKVRLGNTLWKVIPGIQTASTTNSLPAITLVSGDIAVDNKLGVDDYNAMLSCIKGTCGSDQKALADLNADNKVDEIDLNILYAGFANRNGD